MNNILITGANGQLGTELKLLNENYKIYNCYYTDIDNLDITNIENIRNFIKNKKIDYIINCAAYTNVDKAESEPKLAELINSYAVYNLSIISNEINATLINISTDFVFDGNKSTPYIETDITNPISVYGKSKLNGENQILKFCNNFIIIRTSWLYSPFGKNFVKTIQKIANEKESIKVVFDQVGTPTYAKDLADAILNILPKLNKNCREIFHYSNEGVASWYDFANAIVELSNIKCKVEPIETKDFPTPAKRPHFSVLNKYKIKNAFNLEIPYWRNSLINCLKRMDTI